MERNPTRGGAGTSAKPRNSGWPSRGSGSADFRHLDLGSCHATPGRVDPRPCENRIVEWKGDRLACGPVQLHGLTFASNEECHRFGLYPHPNDRYVVATRAAHRGLVSHMVRSTLARTLLTLYIVVSLLNVFAEGSGFTSVAFVTVVLAMPLLIALMLTTRMHRDRLTTLVVVALFFSWLGDWLGDLLVPHVVFKIIFFFVGQIFYVMAFLPYRRASLLHRPLLLAGYLVLIGALLAWIAPRSGILAPAVVVYGLLIVTMAVLASGLNWLAAVGSMIFVVSDLSIAVTAFAIPGVIEESELLIMSTYLVAQLMIVLGVIQRQRDDIAPVPIG